MDTSVVYTEQLAARTLKKVKWHIVSFAFLLYFFNVVDRLNIGFAALQMNNELHITALDFGGVTALFFVSYFLFQVPSNIILQRTKANRWIGFILFAWGVVTLMTFFVQSVNQFMICRFLLGVFEAGFFPGMIFYFCRWFPSREMAKVTALFMLAGSISSAVASPISGWIIQNIRWYNFSGWRWLFAIEGTATAFLGIMAVFYLINKPQDAKWLKNEEKEWLISEIKKEQGNKDGSRSLSFFQVLSNRVLWRLACIYMFVQGAAQAATFWLPGIVKEFSGSFSDTQVGIVMALPFVCASFAMPLWAAHSDKTNERKFHAGLPMLLFGIAFLAMALVQSLPLKIIALAFYGIGTYSYYGPFWALPGKLLSPESLAVSVAVINSCSSLGGFGANYLNGYVATFFGTTGILIFSVILCVISFLLVVTMPVSRTTEKIGPKVSKI
jgi:MFS transporter, ACS family, tartrate transporter